MTLNNELFVLGMKCLTCIFSFGNGCLLGLNPSLYFKKETGIVGKAKLQFPCIINRRNRPYFSAMKLLNMMFIITLLGVFSAHR